MTDTQRRRLRVFAAVLAALLAMLAWSFLEHDEASRALVHSHEPGPDATVPRRSAAGEGSAIARTESPAAVVRAEEPTVAALAGRVVDEGGRPVGGAAVVALPAGSLETPSFDGDESPRPGSRAVRTTTSDDGRFELRLSADVMLALVCASKEGMSPSAPQEVDVPRRDVELVLDSGFILHGRVHDAAGKSISGARLSYHAMLETVAVKREATSGEEGRYELRGIPVTDPFGNGIGAEFLVVEAGGYAPRTIRRPIGYWTRRMAREGRIAFDVSMERGGTIRGRVVEGRNGGPVADVDVELWSLEGRDFINVEGRASSVFPPAAPRILARCRTDARGSFAFDCVPLEADGPARPFDGSPTLRVVHDGSAVACAAVEGLDHEVPSREVELVLHPGAAIRGRVLDLGGEPVADSLVTFAVDGWLEVGIDFARTHLGQRPPRRGFVGWERAPGKRGAAKVLTGRDGRFESPRFPLAAREPTRVGFRAVNTLPDDRHEVLLRDPAGVDVGEIVVRTYPSWTLEGRVVDQEGRPVPHARVSGGKRREVADVRGRFAFLVVDEDGERVPERLEIHAPGHVELVTDLPETIPDVVVDFVLERGCVLAGEIVDQRGTRVGYGHVRVFRGTGSRDDLTWDDLVGGVTAGTLGAFRMDDLPPPPWHVKFATHLDDLSGWATVRAPREDGRLVLPGVMTETCAFSVLVTDAADERTPPAVNGCLRLGHDDASLEAHRPGAGRLEWPRVPVGAHVLEVAARGYVKVGLDVDVEADMDLPFVVRLTPAVDVDVRIALPPTAPTDLGWFLTAMDESQAGAGSRSTSGRGTSAVSVKGLAPGEWAFRVRASGFDGSEVGMPPGGIVHRTIYSGESVEPVALTVAEVGELRVPLPCGDGAEPSGNEDAEGRAARAKAAFAAARRLQVVLERAGRRLHAGPASRILGRAQELVGSFRLPPGLVTVEVFDGRERLVSGTITVRAFETVTLDR